MPENIAAHKSALPDLKAELVELVRQKKSLTESLSSLEKQIYLFEGSYLEDTAPYGNIIKGWDKFLASASSTNSLGTMPLSNKNANDKKIKKFRECDRLFSNSSVTSSISLNSHMDSERSIFGEQNKIDGEDHVYSENSNDVMVNGSFMSGASDLGFPPPLDKKKKIKR